MVAGLRDGTGSVLPSLHVEHVSRNVGETVLVLVGQRGGGQRVVLGHSGQSRVGVVGTVVVLLSRGVGKSEEQGLDRVHEVELRAVLAHGSLGSVVLLELLDGHIDGVVLVGSALVVRDQHVLGPLVHRGDLEGLVARHLDDVREVHGARLLIHPLRGVVDHISGHVLLHAQQVGQIGLHHKLLLDVVQRGAAQRQGVARIARVVERQGQLDHRGRQVRVEGLQSCGVADELLVQSPLVARHAVLGQEIQHDVIVRLDGQVVELERTLLPDVVGQVPGVGNAPGQLTVVGRVDRQARRGGLHPRHEGEVSSLGELVDGLRHGSRVGVRSKQLRVPGVLLDLTREQRGDLVSSVPELIELVVGRDVHVSDCDCCGRLGRHFSKIQI